MKTKSANSVEADEDIQIFSGHPIYPSENQNRSFKASERRERHFNKILLSMNFNYNSNL